MNSTQILVSATSFAELGVAPDLIDVLEGLGITKPFPIQALTIPDGLAGRDVCGKAETGSGKTLAFGIPLIEQAESGGRGLRSLVLVPTRELCKQVAKELERLASRRGLSLQAVYGGVPMRRQIDQLRAGVEVLVATPGRLIDLLDRKLVSLADLRCVVIDEADQMADMGFLPQVHRIMREAGGGHQTMLFSATLDGQIGTLVQRYLKDPVRHEAETPDPVADVQEHRFIAVHELDKAKVTAAITRGVARTLVFVATKRGADGVSRKLKQEGVQAAAIHSDLRQAVREKTLASFSSGTLPVLVATNLAARGLHIEDIDVVIHYDPPADFKSFIHRSGRTARVGKTGLVITLVLWDQIAEVRRLQRASGLHQEITKMYSNDPRLEDLMSFQPNHVELKSTSLMDVSRRARPRRRNRRRR